MVRDPAPPAAVGYPDAHLDQGQSDDGEGFDRADEDVPTNNCQWPNRWQRRMTRSTRRRNQIRPRQGN